jgi:bifunctional DNA-binding transcriptional regulator/antitoxin component of YhaV-PrlF toxin-antitoxin module
MVTAIAGIFTGILSRSTFCTTAKQNYCSIEGVTDTPTFVTVQSRGLIALPISIRRRFGPDQPRAQVEVIERGDEIVLRPHVAVPTDQAWFWANRWREMEREADDDVAGGRVAVFEGVDELLADLDS